jgi:DNA replication protein
MLATKTAEQNPLSYDNIFQLFEQEFGRPLSPFECEHLTQWLDEDGHSEELIEAALREAVFCSKVSFRYIDRILLEWHRHGVRTVEEAIVHAKKFRQKGMLYQAPTEQKKENTGFSFYNWVNQE